MQNSFAIDQKSSFIRSISKFLPLLFLVGLYIYNLAKYFWTLPAMSDPLQYIGPASWHTTWAYFTFLDRLALAVNLRIFVLLFSKAYLAGMIYVGVVNTLLVILAMFWAFKKSGFWAAFFVGLFMNSSYLMLGWATYLYPDQTVALYSLLAFIFFFSNLKERRFLNPALLAGIFTALAVLSKATGAGILIFFLIYLFYRKDWKKILRFLIGFAVGLIIIILLFILLYNWQSLINTYQMFMNKGLKTNLNIFIPQEASGFFHEYLLSLKYFPYLALFITLGAYRFRRTRRLFLAAWSFIILLVLIRPSGPSIPTYIYPAYIFVCLGLAIYLAELIKSSTAQSKYDKYLNWLVPILMLLLVVAGLFIGFRFSPVASFNWAYNYLTPLDIYNLNNLTYPLIIKRIYAFIPIVLLVMLSASELWRKKKIILLFMLVASFFLPLSNGGLAYQKAKYDRESAAPFYQIAPLLNKVSVKQFSVYIKELNENYDYCSRAQCLFDVYRLFFNEKYQKEFQPRYKSQFLNELEILDNVTYIAKEEDLLSKVKGEQIITDSPDVVRAYFPAAKEIEQVSTTDGKRTMTIMDIAQVAALQKTIYFTFEENFAKWGGSASPSLGGPTTIKAADVQKYLPPLQITGLRGGEFEISYINNQTIKSIRVGLNKNMALENSEINLGYSLKNDNSSKMDAPIYVTLEIDGRLSNKKDGLGLVFIQDKTADWSVLKTSMDSSEWKEYSISKKLREGASDVIAGISLTPTSINDWLEIKKIKISIWSFSAK